ncbi:MAG: OadG family protein [Clostridiales bacterium]|nr:OadG family protein [Clostridiales bacterium]
MELSNGMVVSIGVGTVFFGLICLVLLCYIMSAVCKAFTKNEPKQKEAISANVPADTPIANKQELVAASCAVIAEELGTEVKNIKVLSFKRV